MENMVSERLKFFSESNKIIPNTQHGFRYRRSTLDPLLGIEKEIRTALVKRQVTVLVFFDLKAAFDTVDHVHLLHALAKGGVGGKMLSWIEDFLMDRKICVQMEDIISESVRINKGVPQGSGISTILFILLLSTLPKVDPIKSNEFADDICYSITCDTYEECHILLSEAIARFASWAKEKGLEINTSKTRTMIFTRKTYISSRLHLEGIPITEVLTFKYLGVTLDAPTLTWTPHILSLQHVCSQTLNLMKSLAVTKFGADRASLLQIYNSLIKSKISYSSPLLTTASQTNLDILERIQNSALRIATGALRPTPIPSLQCEANVLPMNLYLSRQAIKTYFKVQSKGQQHPIEIHTDPEEDEEELVWTETFHHPFKHNVQSKMLEWEIPDDTYDSQIEYPKIPPWEPLESFVALDLAGKETKAHTNLQLKASSIETIEKRYKGSLLIYTDGSKISEQPTQRKSTTAAFHIPEYNIDRKWKLDPDISIAGAEMSAIYFSLEWLLHCTIPPGKVAILTDSKVSLHLILQRKPKSYAHRVSEIHSTLMILREYQKWEVYFQWVPSHCGLQGNTKADALAAEGHQLNILEVYPLEFEERMLRLDAATKRLWQSSWTNEINGCSPNHLRHIKEKIGPLPHTRIKNRPLDVIFTRFRLGKTRLNYHLNQMKMIDSPNCQQCDIGCPETTSHFFMECESYSQNRQILFQNIRNLGIHNPSLHLLLGKSDLEEGVKCQVTHEVAAYIQRSGRVNEI